jgi:hypothetical protein
MEPDRRGPKRSMDRAHTVDAAWTALMLDVEFGMAPMRPVVRSAAYRAGELRLAVQCRRRVASVRRLFDATFPPYRAAAAKLAHP